MSETLVLNQELIGDSLLSDYKVGNDTLADIFPRADFLKLPDEDVETLVKSFLTKETTDKLRSLLTTEEIYDVLSTPNLKDSVEHVFKVDTVKDALISSISYAEQYTAPSAIVAASTPDEFIKNLESWKKTSKGSFVTVYENDEEITYKFTYNNEKSLFLAILFAVPELLNQLVLHFNHVDLGNEGEFIPRDVVEHFKKELKQSIKDSNFNDEQFMDELATIVFISFGKIIENMAVLFQKSGVKVKDTRAAVIDFVLKVADIGIVVNDSVWGNEDNVLDGVYIEFDTDNSVLKVVNKMVFITKYSILDQYKNWVPSSFYYKYNIHGKEKEKTSWQFKTTKPFWERVIFDAYNANKSPINNLKYIKTKLR